MAARRNDEEEAQKLLASAATGEAPSTSICVGYMHCVAFSLLLSSWTI